MIDVFWKKLIKEYFPTLTKRRKQTSHLRYKGIKVGDLMIIAENNIEESK